MTEENQKIRIRIKELFKLLDSAQSDFRQGLPISAGLTLHQIEAKSFDLANDLIKRK